MKHCTIPLVILLAAHSVHAQAPAAPATTGPAANATYSISGVVDAYFGSKELSGSARTLRLDSGGMSTSQINFNATKELGNGLKAEVALGAFFRADDGGLGRTSTDTTFGRNSYIGISGDMGSVRLGRQGTSNFLNFLRTNSFGDSATFGPAFLHTWLSAAGQGTQFLSATGAPTARRTLTAPLGSSDSAWNNSIKYLSPSVGGATFTAQYAPSEADGVGDRSELSAFYANGPLNLSLATEQIGRSSVPSVATAQAVISGQSTWHASAAYAFGFGRLSSGVINTQRTFSAIPNDQITTLHLGASIPVGLGAVLLQTAMSTLAIQGGTDVNRTTTSVAYDYNFTKEADLYVVVMHDKLSNETTGVSLGAGVRYRF
jgi:predicted porin